MHLDLLVGAIGFNKRRTPPIKRENEMIHFDTDLSNAIWLIVLLIFFAVSPNIIQFLKWQIPEKSYKIIAWISLQGDMVEFMERFIVTSKFNIGFISFWNSVFTVNIQLYYRYFCYFYVYILK